MKRGATLLELTAVIAVLMVVFGAVFIGTLGHSNDYRALRNAARVLQADMRYAQRRAVMEGRRIGVQFEVRYNRYQIVTFAPYIYPLSPPIYLPNGVNLQSVNFPQNQIIYLPRGTGQAGTILLEKGRYSQQLTTTVGGGRVEIMSIIPNQGGN
jgi:type II secretory pathway pseudopilin PulG